MEKQLTEDLLGNILTSENLDTLSHSDLVGLICNYDGISKFAPDGYYQIDPRNGERIVYNSSRARRPHDNANKKDSSGQASNEASPSCVICEGKTTSIIDIVKLSTGFSFINENLFPMVHPKALNEPSSQEIENGQLSTNGIEAKGMHFLHWTSSLHANDWENMPLADLELSFRRMATLEKKLLNEAPSTLPSNEAWGDSGEYRGYVSIIKNFGRPVGGSLAHGHQQICYSNIMPRRFLENLNFERQHKEKFSAYLNRVTGADLEVIDLGDARLVVPYFMRRPYDMFLLVKDASKRYLHQLNDKEVSAVVKGWKVATRAMLSVVNGLDREAAYNVVVFNGPGSGIYIEFLPFTQETGGYELAGLSVCQSNPSDAASRLREIISDNEL